ncbi:MAG: hypothetical protein RIF41_34410 [Polyangiaceae bacterium]
MVTRALVLIGLLSAASGCWTDVRPAPPELPPREGVGDEDEGEQVAQATAQPKPEPVVPEVDTDQLEPPLPTIQFADTAGTTEANVKQWFSRSPESLSRCMGIKGIKVTVYVTAREGDVYASLDETDADAGTASCVLEVVAFELDNAFTVSTSPSERPNTVESVLILAW